MSIEKEETRWEGLFDIAIPVILAVAGGLSMMLGGYDGYNMDWSDPVMLIGALTAIAGAVIFLVRFGKMVAGWFKKKKE